MLRSEYERIRKEILLSLGKLQKESPWRQGWKRDEIYKSAGFSKHEIHERILEDLLEQGVLKLDGGEVSTRDHRPVLDGRYEPVRKRLEKMLLDAQFSPDFRGDLIKKLSIDEKTFKVIEDFMVKAGQLRKISPEFLILKESIESAQKLVSGYIVSHGGITPAEARDLLKTSRKYIIPLLEYMDQIRLTKREGDRRILA